MQYPYQDPTLTTKQRVSDLLQRMSLEEKVRQLGCTMIMGTTPAESLDIAPGIGELAMMGGGPNPSTTADYVRRTQQYIIEKSPHGIPAIFHCEALCGPMMANSNMFPLSIGLAATFAPDIVQRMSEQTRKQMLGLGIRQALSPVLDIARDLRWGRTCETYGGDPTLSAAMTCAFVDGLQGENIADGVAATAKHFLGYSQTEGGLNMSKTHVGARDLREVFAKPFEAAIRRSGVKSVMNSYSEYEGKPIGASKEILTDLLRHDLGFEGLVVSDYMTIPRLVSSFYTAETLVDAGVQCLEAGLDVECPNRAGYADDFISAAAQGAIDISFINRSVERVLTLKFELGLFENPYPRTENFDTLFDNTQNDRMSLEATQKLMTLTKNDGLLPIVDRSKKLAVIGPAGNCLRMLFGGYTYPTALEMISGAASTTEMAGVESSTNSGESMIRGSRSMDKHRGDPFILARQPNAKTTYGALAERFEHISFVEGCDYVGDDQTGFSSAIEAARQAEIVILAVGGKNGWGLHCTTGEGIDSASLDLPGQQEALMREIYAANPNIVLVHTDGRPLVSEWAYEHIPAILEAWLPCAFGGEAIAQTITGENVPAGRLPMDVPRAVGHTPCYHYANNGSGFKTIRRCSLNSEGYIDSLVQPLRPFGYGLSYTTFEYSNLQLHVDDLGMVTATVTVHNTGSRTSDEVVQLYGRDEIASVVRPEQELIGFRRVTLAAQENQEIVFRFALSQLAFYQADGSWLLEKGTFSFFAGSHSSDEAVTETYTLQATRMIEPSQRSFFAE